MSTSFSDAAPQATASEKDVLKYYYYISNGIDTDHISSMEQSWMDNILERLAPALRQGMDGTIEGLADEIREEYLLSVKKAIVDFVLKDPSGGPGPGGAEDDDGDDEADGGGKKRKKAGVAADDGAPLTAATLPRCPDCGALVNAPPPPCAPRPGAALTA